MHNFSGEEFNKEIKYFDINDNELFFENFKTNLKDADTEIKNYNPVPFTWGTYHTISKIEKVKIQYFLISF